MDTTCAPKIFEAIEVGNVNEVRQLLRAHPDLLNFYFIGGGTWLHQAASHDNVAMVQMLIEAGIGVNAPRKDDPENPLDQAACSGCVKVARWLLDHGAKMDNGGGMRGTTLIGAVNSGSLEMVKLLVERGADVNVTYDKPPKNALSHALMYGYEDIAKLLRAHGAVEPQSETAKKPTDSRDKILHHVTKHIGPVQDLKLAEIVPGVVSVAVHVVPPSKRREHITLFTTGMSDRSMTVPKGEKEYCYAELLIQLPHDWPLTLQAFKDPKNFWPIEWLRRIAHYPHENDTWLGSSHAIIANGEPPERFAPNTGFTCMLLLTEDSQFGCLKLDKHKIINFYTMIPLYTEERNLELEKGTPYLLHLFQKHNISTVVNVDRKNVGII